MKKQLDPAEVERRKKAREAYIQGLKERFQKRLERARARQQAAKKKRPSL